MKNVQIWNYAAIIAIGIAIGIGAEIERNGISGVNDPDTDSDPDSPWVDVVH